MDHKVEVGGVYKNMVNGVWVLVLSVSTDTMATVIESGSPTRKPAPIRIIEKLVTNKILVHAGSVKNLVVSNSLAFPGLPVSCKYLTLIEASDMCNRLDFYFEQDRLIELYPYEVIDHLSEGNLKCMKSTSVANNTPNTTNEICNYCNGPTEPVIGRMRICRKCER